ncbi:unnamed protein product, partial [Mesorhabditis belari]|uniref:Secreted protein n=1 Tax=Mesorhabditis belari TaxID=2138241 RepID=A0AAF3J4F6_9BILA
MVAWFLSRIFHFVDCWHLAIAWLLCGRSLHIARVGKEEISNNLAFWSSTERFCHPVKSHDLNNAGGYCFTVLYTLPALTKEKYAKSRLRPKHEGVHSVNFLQQFPFFGFSLGDRWLISASTGRKYPLRGARLWWKIDGYALFHLVTIPVPLMFHYSSGKFVLLIV